MMIPSTGGRFMKSLAAATLSLAVLAGSAAALEPVREGQESMISRGIYADGKLWVLSDAGQLLSITDGATGPETVILPEPALDLWLDNGRPAVVTCALEKCRTWTLRRWIDGAWQTFATIPAERDKLATVASDGAGTLLLTSRRVLQIADGQIHELKLQEPIFNNPPKDPLDYGRLTSILVRPDSVYFGLNAGEWGGGLWKIDRKTGAIAAVKDKPTGRFGTIISTGLDPVNGLAEEPWKPGCFLAAVGMVHMYSHGRIAEICNDDVQRYYFKPFGDDPRETTPQEGFVEPFSTVAFFSLLPGKDALWAVGIDGLYRVTKDGVEYRKERPKVHAVGGIDVSFELPDVVVVFTEINMRNSLSGATPMIVPR